MATRSRKRDKWLMAIAIFRLLKAALLLAVAIGVIKLFRKDIAEVVERWILSLNLDTNNPFIETLLSKIRALGPGKLAFLCAGTFVYSGLFFTEGIGLLLQKRWAEYFTVIITGSFLPFEIYEITAKHFNVFKLLLLLANVAIFIYLIWRLIHERQGFAIRPRSASAPGFR